MSDSPATSRCEGDSNRPAAPGPRLPGIRVVQSAELFADAREVLIEHAGQQYRLRSTRNGKLILTK